MKRLVIGIVIVALTIIVLTFFANESIYFSPYESQKATGLKIAIGNDLSAQQSADQPSGSSQPISLLLTFARPAKSAQVNSFSEYLIKAGTN